MTELSHDETTLDEILTRVGRLRCGEAVAVFAPLADALAAAHSEGTVHRTIGTHSVRLAADGAVSLVPAARARTRPAGLRAQADDTRAFAVLILSALLGPSNPDNEVDWNGVAAGWAERAFALGVPAGLVTVLGAALADRPEQRPTAAELATALREACDPLPIDRLVGPAQATA